MAAFASNSILCRAALRGDAIDPATFTALRIGAGAAILVPLAFRNLRWRAQRAAWFSAASLFLYAIAFSLAYLALTAGTGALILFGCVQATLLASALRSGERPRATEWLGLAVAIGGLVWLTLPGLEAPPVGGAALMAVAGIAWGRYTLAGRGSQNPLADTARNFLFAVPLAALACLLVPLVGPPRHVSRDGVVLALVSGAVSSGLGYALWYTALRGLTATRAATVQLSVPVIAAAAGVVWLGERVSVRLVVAAALILGGIGLAVATRSRRKS